MECKKCKAIASVILRKKDHYCENCFINNIVHKFRSCIGKHRILSNNENVLIALSGGMGSAVLLDMVFRGTTLDTHKKLRITPICTFISGFNDETEDTEIANDVINMCKKYGFNVYIISANFDQVINLPPVNTLIAAGKDSTEQWKSKLKSLTHTDRNDIQSKMKRKIFIEVAKSFMCETVFTGETTTTLASNLIVNVALGRGSQVEHDVGFCDSRDETVKIIKPMKDITFEELNYFCKVNNLKFEKKADNVNSIQSLIQSFVTDLQDNFPATISTICKTADKIGTNDKKYADNRCSKCQSAIISSSKLTAMEATAFSRVICHGRQTMEDPFILQNNTSTLCYTCAIQSNKI